jgi:hypothetical protein
VAANSVVASPRSCCSTSLRCLNHERRRWAQEDQAVGGILNEEPTAAVQKAVEAGLVEFEKHKKTLLDHLSKNRRAPWLCDDEQWSLRLTRLAKIYYLCQATRPAAQRKADLRKLAETLGQVCTFAEKVRQDSVGSELVSQFFEGILRRDPPAR